MYKRTAQSKGAQKMHAARCTGLTDSQHKNNRRDALSHENASRFFPFTHST